MTSASGSNCCCNGTICQTAACNVQAALSDMLNPPIVDIGHSYRERRLGEFDFSNVVDALRTKLVPLRVAWSQPDVPGPLTNGHFVLAVAVDDQKQSVDLFDPWPVGSKPAISLTASWHTICNNYRPEIGSAQHGARLTHAYL